MKKTGVEDGAWDGALENGKAATWHNQQRSIQVQAQIMLLLCCQCYAIASCGQCSQFSPMHTSVANWVRRDRSTGMEAMLKHGHLDEARTH